MLEPLRVLRFLVFLLAIVSTDSSHVSSSILSTSSATPDSAGAAPTTSLSILSVPISSLGNSTCQSRTANYITHTLPQQCLRTNRAAANATLSALDMTLARGAAITSSASRANAGDISLGTVPLPTATMVNSTHTQVATEATTTPSPSSTSGLNAQSVAASSVYSVSLEPEAETDSPFENANFLSFEEWKKQNLAKAGQSPENVGQTRSQTGDRQRPGINNVLDTLGEESEIELDFSGFGGGGSTQDAIHDQGTPASSDTPVTGQSSPAAQSLRSKDAGKTCKERTNYASFDCAATVLKSNPECKSASSVLVENKDSYMLNTCSAQNKFFIVELCNDILIDTIVLANYEFFSSIFRHFRISVSDRYPVKMEKWKYLGTFEARNTREVQAFLIENPLIWARYLRIEFLSHYGSEYYCPVSLLRVHGTTMMEEFRHQEEVGRGEIGDDEVIGESEVTPEPSFAREPPTCTDESVEETLLAIQKADTTGTADSTAISGNLPGETTNITAPANATSKTINTSVCAIPDPAEMTCANPPETSAPKLAQTSLEFSSSTSTGRTTKDTRESASVSSSSSGMVVSSSSIEVPPLSAERAISSFTVTPDGPSANPSTATLGSASTATPISNHSVTASATSILESITETAPSNRMTLTSNNSTRAVASATSSHAAQPSTQESFFKSIHKRLQQLESNSTLSLQYIEEQSRILRDAFNKVEKRQVTATANFLSHINDTVMVELHGFRQAYDQLWQSTVIELEGQSERYQREMLALSTRLTLVADELVWQKRMGIVQSTLSLLCLALVLFARAGNGYLEMPLVQQMLNKSQAACRPGYDSQSNSPSPKNRSPVRLLRRKLWRSNTEENGNVTDGTDSRPMSRGGHELQVEPPTPASNGAQSEVEEVSEGQEAEVKADVKSELWTPSGTRELNKRPPVGMTRTVGLEVR